MAHRSGSDLMQLNSPYCCASSDILQSDRIKPFSYFIHEKYLIARFCRSSIIKHRTFRNMPQNSRNRVLLM